MTAARFVRELELAPSPDKASPQHISAASGMVVVGEFMYVVSDDELHLGVFDKEGGRGGRLIRLFPGKLPDDHTERKALKPDLEALVRLPAFPGYPHGALLALPSGSRPNRRTGFILQLEQSGGVMGAPRPYDLSPFYLHLASAFPALNIEGAVLVGDQLVLLQRGSKAQPESALIWFPLSEMDPGGNRGASMSMISASRIQTFDLGTIDGVPFGFTDGAALPDGRIVFSAVAENSENTYLDGPCVGAAIGIIGTDGRLETMQRLTPTEKVEGIHATAESNRIRLLMVTDADDSEVPAKLLSAEIRL